MFISIEVLHVQVQMKEFFFFTTTYAIFNPIFHLISEF